MRDTAAQFKEAVKVCRDIFMKKMQDYGSSWRILRLTSLTDQIFIKAKRIRNLEQKGFSKVDEGITPEYIAIVNYAVMALIQLEPGYDESVTLAPEKITELYDRYTQTALDLMLNKNHDYDESWREMRISSLTDLILVKILRIRQIEDNNGTTIISEGVDSNYLDILNYSIFALIRLNEQTAVK